MNRENQLNNLYQHFKLRYHNYKIKFTEEKKLAFSLPCCFSASGMGKTTLFSKGIKKMIEFIKDDDEFHSILKRVF